MSSSYSWRYGYDVNKEFSGDYTYGNDIVSGLSTSTTTAFNSEKQPDGFAKYLSMLSEKNVTGIMDSGVAKKDPYLGNLYDTASTGDSAYKTKAISSGVYLPGATSLTDIVSTLNAGLEESAKFASVDTFYNWKTNETTSVVNIDAAKMQAAGKAPSNGVIYSEVPLMLSDAKDLPGANTGDKTAVFTVVSEESVYLKGNYNTENWKISNIATEKKVYTLSNAFSANTLPDTTVYTNYPYVKVSVTKDVYGRVASYDAVSGDQASAPGTNEVWINADYTTYTTSGTYSYYQGMSDALRQSARSARDSFQNTYVAEHTNPDGSTTFPNNVDASSYSYNSLFVTPYDIDTLENWKYNGAQATRNLQGAFINFYDPNDSRYDDEYRAALGNSEYCATSACSEGFNYRGRKAPWGYLSWAGLTSPTTNQSYDGRFLTASPTSSEGVLGFTGQNSWRPISKAYFDKKTAG